MKEPKIKKEKIWQALRWELSEEELIATPYNYVVYEKDYYFDLELMLDKIHRFMNGEKPHSYFMRWCLIYMRCLASFTAYRSNRMRKVCYEAGDTFDAFAFNVGTPEECRWLIAKLKWYNHCLKNLENKTATEFETNGISIYIRPDVYIEDSDTDLYQVLIVDNAEKRFNIYFIDGDDYSENLNYSFAEYDKDLVDIVYERFADYRFDRTLDLDWLELEF